MGDAYKIYSEIFKGRGQFRDVSMDGMIILKWILT
jgi:hypothetical protein